MKMTDALAVAERIAEDLGSITENDAIGLRDYLRARLAADQQKGGGEVACHRWLRNGESTPSGWISGEPSARQIEAQQMCKEKFGDTADWQVEYAYKAPQPSIPAPAQQPSRAEFCEECFDRMYPNAPAQQDGKASGGEMDDEGPGAAWERWQKIPPEKGEPIREFNSFRAGYYAALAHPPHADQETQG